VQYRPTASELLITIADLLDTEVLPALPPELQHKARVAANLARIIEREERLAPDAAGRERELLVDLLGRSGQLPELRADLASRLRAGTDPVFEVAAWDVLVAIARDDLAIAKPVYDGWEGQ
jgi:hypothetical protein